MYLRSARSRGRARERQVTELELKKVGVLQTRTQRAMSALTFNLSGRRIRRQSASMRASLRASLWCRRALLVLLLLTLAQLCASEHANESRPRFGIRRLLPRPHKRQGLDFITKSLVKAILSPTSTTLAPKKERSIWRNLLPSPFSSISINPFRGKDKDQKGSGGSDSFFTLEESAPPPVIQPYQYQQQQQQPPAYYPPPPPPPHGYSAYGPPPPHPAPATHYGSYAPPPAQSGHYYQSQYQHSAYQTQTTAYPKKKKTKTEEPASGSSIR